MQKRRSYGLSYKSPAPLRVLKKVQFLQTILGEKFRSSTTWTHWVYSFIISIRLYACLKGVTTEVKKWAYLVVRLRRNCEVTLSWQSSLLPYSMLKLGGITQHIHQNIPLVNTAMPHTVSTNLNSNTTFSLDSHSRQQYGNIHPGCMLKTSGVCYS